MIVPVNNQKFWKKHKEKGDVAEIAALIKKSPQTVSKAIKHGRATEEVIIGINSFYQNRSKVIKTK